MRKLPLILILLSTTLFVFSNRSDAKHSGIPLAEYEKYHFLDLQSGNILKKVVILPEESHDELAVTGIIHRLDQLPTAILHTVDEHGIKVVLFQGKLTDNQSLAYLKGITPRGYPENIVWDDVPGIGGSEHVFVKIGSSDKGDEHGSVNLEFHELAHSLFNLVYNDTDTLAQFNRVWQDEAELLFPENQYIQSYIEEYFAESFAYNFLSHETRSILKKTAPQTFELMNGLY